MESKTALELVRGLGKHGLHFRSFRVASEGQWSVEDADWNYKDVPHLNEVHSLADTVPAAIGNDCICTINIQKTLGVRLPIALANYVARDGSQVYFTTLLCYVLVVETRIADIDGGDGQCRARVDTTYHVGGPRAAMLAFPLLRRILKGNYQVLMSEDLPMREQRGRLRSAGYRFASDGRARSFVETTDLTKENVIPPESCAEEYEVDASGLRSAGTSICIGDGPRGFRLVRGDDGDLLVYDRVCSHEGACLDTADWSGKTLVCPWHGKRVKPLAVVRVSAEGFGSGEVRPGQVVEIRDGWCRLRGGA